MKRFISILSVILSATVLMGAGQKDGTTPGTTKTAQSEERIPFNETVPISWLCQIWETNDIGKTTAVEKLIMEATNTNIDFIHVLRGDYATKASVLLASGDLPDIVTVAGISINEWARQGAVIAVDDLLEKHGRHILNKWTDTVRMAATNVEDGKTYAIYGKTDFAYGPGMMIRQDWLDKVGIESPVTVDDYLQVLTAFRDKDPNGNGKADEIPFFRYHSLNVWFYAYGIMAESPDQISGSMTSGMYEVVGGELVPFFYNARYEECLANLAYLYEQKLLDQEYLVRDTTSTNEMVANSIFGSAYVWGGASISAFTNMIRNTSDENGTMIWAAPPKGPYGDAYTNARSPIGTAAAITVRAEDPVKVMMLLDWYFTDEGMSITNFGEEGVHHRLVDGKPKLISPYADSTFTINRQAGLSNSINFMCWLGDAFLQCMTNGQELSRMDELTTLSYEGYVKNEPYAYVFPSLSSIYSTDLNVAKASDVWVPLYDMQNQIIMGAKSFGDMEALLDELQDDIAELTDEANKYYRILSADR